MAGGLAGRVVAVLDPAVGHAVPCAVGGPDPDADRIVRVWLQS